MKTHYVIEHGITDKIKVNGPHVYHDIDKAFQVYRMLVNSDYRPTSIITREQFRKHMQGNGITALDSTGKGRVHVYRCQVTQEHVHGLAETN
jgi:hypothetical protein